MKPRGWTWIGGLILIGIWAGAAADEDAPLGPAFDDARFLMEAAREHEAYLDQSDALYRDPRLKAYVNQVARRLVATVPEADGGFRIEVIKDPHLNAFTYPDGLCYVHTGMLARLENEDQLAALLAHEIVHYIKHHAVNGIRRLHHQAAPAVQDAAENGGASSAMGGWIESAWSGYRHEAEFEADREGLKLMIRAGYDPHEALRLFGHLEEEMGRENYQEPLFFSSHPRLETRIEKCTEFLATFQTERPLGISGENRFGSVFRDVVLDNIALDIQAGRFAQARQASERFLAAYSDDVRAYYLLGEICRQSDRDGKGPERAASFYQRAIECDPGCPEPHRALGRMYYKAGQYKLARPHLEASLILSPDAKENAYIRNYLDRIDAGKLDRDHFAVKSK